MRKCLIEKNYCPEKVKMNILIFANILLPGYQIITNSNANNFIHTNKTLKHAQ